jgi:hypothetical protein
MEAMVQRLDRLTQDEARLAVAQILDVVHGLVKNTKTVMESEQNPLSLLPARYSGTFPVDGKTSVDYLKNALGMFRRRQSNELVSN